MTQNIRQKRSFSELLASRAQAHEIELSKRICTSLQQSAVSLISRHGDLNHLLREVSSSGVLNETQSSADSIDETLSVSGIIDLLNMESERSGQDLSVLAASTCASKLKHLVKCETEQLLSPQYKTQTEVIIGVIKHLYEQQVFNRKLFIKQLNKESVLPVDIIHLLHKENIMPLDTYITCNLSRPHVIGALAQSIVSLSSHHENQEEHRKKIITDIIGYLMLQAFGEAKDDATSKGLRKVSMALLDSITKQIMSMRGSLGINVFELAHQSSGLDVDVIRKYSTHQIIHLLSANPDIKVSEALLQQDQWTFARSPSHVTQIYKQLLLVFEASEVMQLVKRLLEQHEVNWQAVLSFVSTFLVCFQEAPQYIKELVDGLLQQAFQNSEQDGIITAFLLVRQACLEGPHVFMSYTSWFQSTFGEPTNSFIDNKRTFAFLMKFLLDIVPYESAAYLKAHVLKPPHIPAKCRPILSDYIVLAKTRLADLKEPLDQLGIYEQDASSDKSKIHQLVTDDIGKALSSFEKTGKVPSTVMEASIFRKPYYIGKFLPALLKPRPLPDVPDSRMKFIQAIARAEKIPTGLYKAYEKGCKKEADLLLEGVFDDDDTMEDLLLTPVDQLRHSLDQLPLTVLKDMKNGPEKTSGLSGLLSVISEKLHGVMGTENTASMSKFTQCIVDLERPDLTSLQIEVAELFINIFCKTAVAVSSVEAEDSGSHARNSQRAWPTQFVAMVSSHHSLLPAVVVRIWLLITRESHNLSLPHIHGLTLLVFHLSYNSAATCKLLLPASLNKDSMSSDYATLAQVVFSSVTYNTKQRMEFALRLCTLYLQHVFLHSPQLDCLAGRDDAVLPKSLILRFQYLAPRIHPRLRTFQQVQNSHSVPQEERLADHIYMSQRFCQLKKTSPLTVDKWAEHELAVSPSLDSLTEIDRSSYYQWVIHEHYVPLGEGEGGCGGSYKAAASAIMSVLMNTTTRVPEKSEKSCRCEAASTSIKTSESMWIYLVVLLQSLIPYLHLDLKSREKPEAGTWLIRLLNSRLKKNTNLLMTSSEVTTFLRVADYLPAHLLFVEQREDRVDVPVIKNFTVSCLREYATTAAFLPLSITSLLTRGLMLLKESCVDSILKECVLITTSIMYHWDSLKGVIGSHGNSIKQGEKTLFMDISKLLEDPNECSELKEIMKIEKTGWLPGCALFIHSKKKCLNQQWTEDLLKQLSGSVSSDDKKQLLEWWLILILAEITSLVLNQNSYQGDLDKLINTAHTILSVCPKSLEVAVTSKNSIIQDIFSSVIVRLIPVAALRVVMWTESELWSKGQHCSLLLQLHAECAALYDKADTAIAGDYNIYHEVLNVDLMKSFSQYMKQCINEASADTLRCISQELLLACDEDVQMLITKKTGVKLL